MSLGVYIHIPFCVKKCGYCDFLSYAGRADLYDRYYNALIREIGRYSDILHTRDIDSVFFGGGTPTVFPPNFICEILKSLPFSPDAEISVEANPGTVDREYLKILLESGVNRISFGLQSCNDRLLAVLGRIHSFETFRKNYYHALELGFKNINIDLMFALPGQNLKDWVETLDEIILLSPSSISAYSLTIADNTPFGRMLAEGSTEFCDDRLDREMYHLAIKKLAGHGYTQYEISNFSKPGCECRHNIRYWTRGDYLGFGVGAHSFINGVRYENTSDMEEYILSGGSIKEQIEISSYEAMSEHIILGLRLTRGVSKLEFLQKFGADIYDVYPKQINGLITRGLLLDDGSRIKLTDIGLDLANMAMVEFLLES